MLVLRLLAFCLKKVAAVDDVVKQSCQIYFVLFLSADSFSSALLVGLQEEAEDRHYYWEDYEDYFQILEKKESSGVACLAIA